MYWLGRLRIKLRIKKEYSSGEDYVFYEDANGHQWTIVKYKKCRLLAGIYYFYMGDPGSALNEYGYFDLIINYKSEKSRTNVEKEFNDTGNTANNIFFKQNIMEIIIIMMWCK